MAIDENGRWEAGSKPYKIRAGIVLSIFIVYTIFVLVTYTMFMIKARDKHSGLAQRNPRLITLQSIGCLFLTVVGMISTSIQQWPCFLKLWFTNIGFILVYGAISARAIQHIVVSNVHILTNKVARNNSPAYKGGAPQGNMPFLSPAEQQFMSPIDQPFLDSAGQCQRPSSRSSTFSNTEFGMADTTLPTPRSCEKKPTVDAGGHSVRFVAMPIDSDTAPERKLTRRLLKYTRLQRYVTNRALTIYVFGYFLVAVLLSLFINIFNHQFSLSPLGLECKLIWGFIPIVVVVTLFVVIVQPLLLIKCWKLKDAYGIRNDLAVSIVFGGFAVVVTVIWESVLYHLALRWSGFFFSWVSAAIMHFASVAFPLWRAIRHSRDVVHRIHGASNMGNPMAMAIAAAGGQEATRRTEFDAILAEPYEYRLFCDFAASCFCSEMTAFIDEYQILKGLTIVALGTEDMWRTEPSHIEPEYMMKLASNIDNTMGYLAIAGRNQDIVQGTRLQTAPTVSILDTARAAYPQYDISESTPFPVSAMDKLVAIFSVFINSGSYTAVSLPPAMVLRVRERLGRSQLTLTIIDEIKDEILNTLYFDVYTRYARSH
ncbi:hypothetical protein GGF46_001795 [Coemansia sp. RSA 552]|nr:hypothetical protein GGF46_001795 [Coemansia sp. RSA 552]